GHDRLRAARRCRLARGPAAGERDRRHRVVPQAGSQPAAHRDVPRDRAGRRGRPHPRHRLPHRAGMTAPALPDGLVAIVKRDCPTCRLVAPVLADLADGALPLTVYSQDDQTFPNDVKVVDDTGLDVSFELEIVQVPTLLLVD